MPTPKRRLRRRRNRLPAYDYRQRGAYFVTLCTEGKLPRLGHVEGDRVVLSPFGRDVSDAWEGLPGRFPWVRLDASVVMPNHLHGIVVLSGDGNDGCDLSRVIAAFKVTTTDVYRAGVATRGWPPYRRRLWQRSFHDRVVRDEHELEAIREYIRLNPARWAEDRLNPGR